MSSHSEMSRYVVCLSNRGYTASLVVRRLYQALDDPAAGRRGLMRVVDESGEDYLYPASFFAPIALPLALRRAVLAAV